MEKMYTTSEVAAMYGVTSRAVVKWISAGVLRAERVSPLPASDWRIPESALEEFEKARLAASQPKT